MIHEIQDKVYFILNQVYFKRQNSWNLEAHRFILFLFLPSDGALICDRKRFEFNESLKLARVRFSSFFLHPDLSSASFAQSFMRKHEPFEKRRELSFSVRSLTTGICFVAKANGFPEVAAVGGLAGDDGVASGHCNSITWSASACFWFVTTVASSIRFRFWSQILEPPSSCETETGNCSSVCLSYILCNIKNV